MRLEEKVDVSNQNIAAALASFLAARALVREARAQLFPTVTTNPAMTRQRTLVHIVRRHGRGFLFLKASTFNDYTLPFDATWQPDLFGRIRNTVRSAAYGAQASAADLENTRLTLQADVAVRLLPAPRTGCVKEGVGFHGGRFSTVSRPDKGPLRYGHRLGRIRGTGRDSTRSRPGAGMTPSTSSGRSSNMPSRCSPASRPRRFRSRYEPLRSSPPGDPLRRSVPASREASRHRCGRAPGRPGQRTDRHREGSILSHGYFEWGGRVRKHFDLDVAHMAGRFFSIGPAAAETIFDAGLRRATVEQFRAQYDQTVANYRQTVLTAFQQVEDNLASLRILSGEIQHQDAAVNPRKGPSPSPRIAIRQGSTLT